MPIYEYECINGHRFEVFRHKIDDKERVCPECGKLAVRIPSVVNHTFGWTLDSVEPFTPDLPTRDI